MRDHPEARVERCDSDRAFMALRAEWNGLLDRAGCDSVFLTWEWLHGWWKRFGAGSSLRTYLVRGPGGRLVGLAPLYVRKPEGWPSLRVMTFLGTLRVSSEYLDIVAEPELETAVLDEVAAAVRADAAHWDRLELPDILESSLAARLRGRLEATAGVVGTLLPWQVCPFLELPPDTETFMRGFGRRTRESLRRRRRQLKDLGGEIGMVSTRAELDEALEALFDLHGLRWSLRGLPGNLRETRVQDFHREVATAFLDNGWLRLHTARKDGRLVACLYGFAYGGKYFFYQTGFDPDWAHASPGAVLMHHAIEAAIGEGLREFDYLRGPEEYKARWTKNSRNTWRLVAVPRANTKALLHFRTERALDACKKAIKRVLPAGRKSH